MRFPNWFRIAWWIVLLGFVLNIFVHRYADIISGKSGNFDGLITIILIALALAPIYRKFQLFGFNFEQENIDPPKDSDLPKIQASIDKVFDQQLSGKENISEIEALDIGSNIPNAETAHLITTRIILEKELNRLYALKIVPLDIKEFGIVQITNGLVDSGVIDSSLAKVIRDVYSICSLAVHGRPLSKAKIDFVKHVAPKLFASFKAIS